ncbi:hypothetical protein [Nocardia cyriacigeorgica]|uniref:hypothetical protein n=1 Tax=Nocardia cyriacigeorgica TaxID=135487 RepID=UPI003515C67F
MLARQHAQAGTWLERRKVRREISLTLREQRRAEAQARQHQIAWTIQMVNRYGAHALAVENRRLDPTVDHERRARDAKALAEHARDLKLRVLANTRLTDVERGVALEAVELANEDPHGRHHGVLLAKATKFRAVDALRYRAEVARTARELGVDRDTGRRMTAAPSRDDLAEERARLQIQLGEREHGQSIREWTARPVEQPTKEQAEAIQGLRHAQLAWNIEAPKAGIVGRDHLVQQWRNAARQAERAGLSPERIDWEFRYAEHNSVYTAQVYATRGPGHEVHTKHGFFPSEAEAAKWASEYVGETNWAPGVQLKATVHQRGDKTPIRMADGNLEHVAASVKDWGRPQHARQQHEGAEKLAEELASLKQRHHLSIEHNGELSDQNAVLTRELTALRAEREQLIAERDRFKTERDESVQKLAERTPASDRLGSPERIADEHRAANAPKREPIAGHAFAGLVNGREREGMER